MLKFSLCALIITLHYFFVAESIKVDNEFLDRVLYAYNTDQPCSRQIVLVNDVSVQKEQDNLYDLSKITLHGETKTGDKRNISLSAIEVAPDGFRRTLALETGVFEKIFLVYTQVLPRMKDLMKTAGDTSESLFLDLIDAKNGSYVVVRTPGFGWSLGSDKVPSLQDQVLALRSLAKWQAMSAVLLEKENIPEEPFAERLPMKRANHHFSCVLDNFSEVVRATWGKKWSRLGKQMKETVSQVDRQLQIIFNLTNEQDAFNVFNYGDFHWPGIWLNYGITDAYATDHPIAIKFERFESAHINTPATDIHKVIYSTPNTRMALKYKDDLIENVYYPALIGYLSKFGYGGKNLTLTRLKDELRQSELYAFITCINTLVDVFREEPVDMAILEETWKTGQHKTNNTQMLRKGFTDAMKPVMEYARDKNVFGGRDNDDSTSDNKSESESDSDSD